jgi:hypothetical protein
MGTIWLKARGGDRFEPVVVCPQLEFRRDGTLVASDVRTDDEQLARLQEAMKEEAEVRVRTVPPRATAIEGRIRAIVHIERTSTTILTIATAD